MADGGRGAAGRRRPLTPSDRLRDPARDQAQARQLGGSRGTCGRVPDPIVGLPRLHAGVPRPHRADPRRNPARPATSSAARPARRPHPGGKDLGLGHLAGGDQDLQRVQQAAIRRRGMAARRRRLHQPGRRLRRPAQPVGLPAGRLKVTGQLVVRA